MTASVEAATWRAVHASQRGSSHGPGVPNQDAVRCERSARPGHLDVWVAAVADGHGGQRYVRSDVGARTAVDVAVDTVREALRDSPDDAATVLRAQVPGIVAAWRAAVREHARAHPLTPDEQVGAGVQTLDDGSLTAYGATLLVAVVGEEGVAVAQVGDGDALVRSHGFATRPVPGDPRLVAGETTSLCLDSAVEDFRFAVVPATAESDLVLLATDGYANSFAQPDWWHALVGDVASFVDRLGFPQLEERLPDWLEESARVGGDDVSAVVLVRDPLAVDPTTTSTDEGAAGAAGSLPRTVDLPPDDEGAAGASQPSSGEGRRRPVLALVAFLVASLVILGAAVLVLRPGVPESPPVVPPEPTSTTPPSDEGGRGGADGRTDRGEGRETPRPPSSKPSRPQQREQEPPDVDEPPAAPGRPLPGGAD